MRLIVIINKVHINFMLDVVDSRSPLNYFNSICNQSSALKTLYVIICNLDSYLKRRSKVYAFKIHFKEKNRKMDFSFGWLSIDICSTKGVKGQALAKFLADHPCDDVQDINEAMFVELDYLEVVLWWASNWPRGRDKFSVRITLKV